MRPVHILHRQAERPRDAGFGDRQVFQRLDQAGALVPGRGGGPGCQVVAPSRAHRNRRHRAEAQISDQFSVGVADTLKRRWIVRDQIDLVHRQNDVANAEQSDNAAVARRLGRHALDRIHQHDRCVAGRGAGGHVARILLMPRRISDDEAATRRRHIAIGNVDGDALLALGLQPVQQQGVIQVGPIGAEPARVAFQRRQLVLRHLARLEQQPPDQGRLAVVHGAAGQKAQQVAFRPLALRREGRRGAVHQK
ncbi:hypothetical protein D3C86_1359120 [compost metagenome]